MSQTNDLNSLVSSEPESDQLTSNHVADEFDLLYYLEVIINRWRIFVRVAMMALLCSTIISLLLTNIYSSTSRILPPQQDNSVIGMMGALNGGMAGLTSDLLGKSTTTDLYVGILNSESIKDEIIDRFRLMEVYKQKYRLDAYNLLGRMTNISADKKSGIIAITVEDKDPRRAAEMANAYVDELAKLTVKLDVLGAGQNSNFLEKRLTKAKSDMAVAEENLKAFQANHKMLDVKEQAKASIESIARLQAQLTVQEVQLAILLNQYTEASQEVKAARSSIDSIRNQISQLEGVTASSSIPGLAQVPSLSQKYLHLMRELKIQEAVVELLAKQYEVAKLAEAKDVSALQVLQVAKIPDKNIKPQRTIIILITTLIVLFGTLVYVLIIEASARLAQEDKVRLKRIQCVLSDIFKFHRS